MLHTSTLIHDDILDNGTVRRGLPTLWMSIGVGRAILVGTLMSTRALALARADSVALADEFFETFDRVNSAQLWELQERGRLKDKASHETISTGKSSAPMELALVVGCMSSPLWPMDLTHLRLGIRELGVGFQLFDDVEDFQAWRGDSGRESKRSDSDVELGNYTMPVTLLLVESAGGRHKVGDPVSVETLRGLSENDWQPSLTATVRIGLEHLKRSERHLTQEVERSRSPLSFRVRSFLQWMIESWREKGLERTVRDMPLEAESMIASTGQPPHQTPHG
jgi:geranylgeranyl diphosphate synthase type I